jgi:hypothetical protein
LSKILLRVHFSNTQIERLVQRIRPLSMVAMDGFDPMRAGSISLSAGAQNPPETRVLKADSASHSDIDARIAIAVAQARADADMEAKAEVEAKAMQARVEVEQRVRAQWEQASLEELLRQLTPGPHWQRDPFANQGLLVTKFDSGSDKADHRWLFIDEGATSSGGGGDVDVGVRLCWRKLDSKSVSSINIEDISLPHCKCPDPKRPHLSASVSLQLKSSSNAKKDRSELNLLFASQPTAERFLKLLERLEVKLF